MVMYKQTLCTHLAYVRVSDITARRGKHGLINSDYPLWRKIKLNLCLSVSRKGKAELQLSEDSIIVSLKFGGKRFLTVTKAKPDRKD